MKLFFSFLIFFSLGQAEEPPALNFTTGVQAYKQQDFKKAQEVFTTLAQDNSDNSTLLYNLGLSEYQLGNIGMALGLWRRAKTINPDFLAPQAAVSFVEENILTKEPSSSVFSVIGSWLMKWPLNLWLTLCLASFMAFFGFAIHYGAKQKKPLLEWPLWLHSLLPVFLVALIFSSLLVFDRMQLKATVIEKNLKTHAGPSESSPTLSELQEGQIVHIETSHGGWVQVRTQNGHPGWVPQKSLIAFGGL